MKHLNLQDNDKEAKKLKVERLPKSLENIQEIFYYQKLLYISKIISSKLISMRSIDRPFWYRQNLRANSLKVFNNQYWIFH